MVVITVSREVAAIARFLNTARQEAVHRVQPILSPNLAGNVLIREENRFLDRVNERARDVVQTVVPAKRAQVAVRPPLRLRSLTPQRRNHERSVQSVCHAHQRSQRHLNVLYASLASPPLTLSHQLHREVLPVSAVLPVQVQRVQLHLLQTQLLPELPADVVVVEEVVDAVYASAARSVVTGPVPVVLVSVEEVHSVGEEPFGQQEVRNGILRDDSVHGLLVAVVFVVDEVVCSGDELDGIRRGSEENEAGADCLLVRLGDQVVPGIAVEEGERILQQNNVGVNVQQVESRLENVQNVRNLPSRLQFEFRRALICKGRVGRDALPKRSVKHGIALLVQRLQSQISKRTH